MFSIWYGNTCNWSKKLYVKIHIILILIRIIFNLIFFFKKADSEYCSWSNQTLNFVTSCPETKTEVAKRAALKSCEPLAFIQNCTEPTKYKYHCVMNEFQTAFVEVCAPSSYILGMFSLMYAMYAIESFTLQDVFYNREISNTGAWSLKD